MENLTPAHELSNAELEAVPLSSNLQGWLMKRHQTDVDFVHKGQTHEGGKG